MKKLFFPFLFILSIAFIGYEHRNDIHINKKFIFRDPAEYVLNANIPQTELIDTFYNDVYGHIELDAGIEQDYGFRHILARHTTQYFVNFENKNSISVFDKDVTGRDIIEAIRNFYKICVESPQFNFLPQKNVVYIGFVKIKDKKLKCLLVINTDNKSIVTFYPFEDEEWKEQLEQIGRIQELIEQQNLIRFD